MRIKYFLITAILVTAVLCSAGFVKAQTVDNSALIAQLKAQIQALMQQIAALQDQQSTTQTWCHTFNANIGVGVKKGNPEIDALTVALQKEGIIEQGTTFSEGYDENLASAVTGFQEKYTSEILTPLNLKHGTGYIGKSTRAKLNALYGCQTVCTQDAKQCPDGSYVSRTGPSCEFAQCPTTQCTTDSDCPQPTCTSPTNTSATSTCLGSVNKCINGKCILTPTTPSITVTSPNGGETWAIGETHNITWTSTAGIIGNVAVWIQQQGGSAPQAIIASTPNTGSASWTIPANIAPANNYRIGVSGNNNNIVDWSNNNLTITATNTPSITVTSPNGGEQWQVGQTYRITWSSIGLSSTDKVSMNVRNTAVASTTVGLVSNVPALQGYYDWKVYIYDMPTSDTYSVGVYLASNPYVNAASNNFTILYPTTPSITILSPNGGETYKTGDSITVNWQTTNIPSFQKLDVIRLRAYPNGQEYNLAYGVVNDGQEVIPIPSSVPVGAYTLEIKAIVSGVTVMDSSDSYFKIVSVSQCSSDADCPTLCISCPLYTTNAQGVGTNCGGCTTYKCVDGKCVANTTPSVTVLSPNGGESWLQNSTQTVFWSSVNIPSSNLVKIVARYYKDIYPSTAYTDYTLVESTLNDGAEKVDIIGFSTGIYTIQVKTIVNNVVIDDWSDSYFKITSVTIPSITVTSPNGGEIWEIGSKQTIKWTSTNIPSSHLLYHIRLRDSVGKEIYLLYNTINDGEETIVVSSSLASGLYRLEIKSEVDGYTVFDTSDGEFKITSAVSPSITVTSPNGGETWAIGETHVITWTSTGITGDVAVWIQQHGGAAPQAIIASTPNTGSASWTISSNIVPASNYRIGVSANNNNLVDWSDNDLSIAAATVSQSITIISPSGGEQWQVGQTYRITWSSIGLSSTDKVSMNVRNTAVASTTVGLVSNVPALQGYYDWKVYIYDMPTSDNYSIGVYLASNPSVNAASNNFTILYPTSITVTSPNGGETLTVGQTYNITWTSQGSSLPPYSSIDLLGFSNGQYMLDYKITTTALTSSGSYSWIVPSSSSIVTGSTYQYKVDVTLGGSGTTFDYSDNYFTIVVPTASVPSAPSNLTATVYSSSQINLSWQDNSSNETGFKVERSTDGINFTEVIANPYPNVTTFYDGNRTSGTTYYYRVRAYNNSGNSAYSNIASATAPAITTSITVTSPNGGETLIEGQTYSITWNAQGAYQQYSLIKLYNYVNDQAVGTFQYQITNTALTASGSYSWTVPTTGIPAGSTYKISVMLEGVVGSIWDVSDNYISIVAPTTNLNVL